MSCQLDRKAALVPGQDVAVDGLGGYTRYVAIGDSSTEGLDDPAPGGGFRGWADRLAGHVAHVSPDLLYANLAVRGRLTAEIESEQLGPALALEPDLVSLFGGVNDLLRRSYDADATQSRLRRMFEAFRGRGATVVTITSPDLSAINPIARLVKTRVADYNERLRVTAADTGTLLLDIAAVPICTDPRLWSDDRLHTNTEGHTRIAAGPAELLGLPGFDGTWRELPGGATTPSRLAGLAADARWFREHAAPWFVRRARGASSGDEVTAKRPELSRLV